MNKKIAAFGFIFIFVLSMLGGAITVTNGEPSAGVKEGDWIEYDVRITGPTYAPSHNITWFRIEILNVEGAAFEANVTVRNVNGTFNSSVWNFNLTEGNVEGWVIIPSNLSPGDAFYDGTKPGNITIEGQEQKTVAGATRTITRASDSIRLVKEWDKATGVYTYSVEHPKNLTVVSQATATNMWSPQILGLNQTVFYVLVAVSAVLAAAVITVLLYRRHQKSKPPKVYN